MFFTSGFAFTYYDNSNILHFHNKSEIMMFRPATMYNVQRFRIEWSLCLLASAHCTALLHVVLQVLCTRYTVLSQPALLDCLVPLLNACGVSLGALGWTRLQSIRYMGLWPCWPAFGSSGSADCSRLRSQYSTKKMNCGHKYRQDKICILAGWFPNVPRIVHCI